MKKTRTLFLALLTAAGLVHADYDDWSGHRPIVLNTTATGANVAGDVYDFPVLIRLGAAELSILGAAKAGGADIRFSKADDATPLPYQIESWSPTAAAIWVKVDTILGNNSTQTIRMHWGNGDATSESNGAAVFDTTGGSFTGVWHMNGTDGELDATANDYDATATGAPASVAGVIGTSRKFNADLGFGQFLTVTNSASSKLNYGVDGPYSVSAWVNADSVTTATPQYGTGHAIFNKGNDQWALAVYGTASHKFYEITTKGNNTWQQVQSNNVGVDSITANPGAGSWHLVTGTWEPTQDGSIGRIYVDGKLYNSRTITNGGSPDQGRNLTRNVFIGNLGGTERGWWGLIDEVSASSMVRSADWIKLSYESQKAENSLTDIGLPASVGYDDWSDSREITLNTSATGADVAGDVHNFPVLIRLGADEDDILSEANSDGSDIRFSKADGVTPLPYEIESWGEDAAVIWVKVDTIKGNNADQSIMMYWGNPAADDASNAAAVFDTTDGFVATYHMNGDSVETDVTGNDLNAAATGTVPAVNGLIGKARSYAGTTENYLSVPNSAEGKLNFSSETNYTLSAWVYSEETTLDNRGIFNKGNDQWLIGVYGGNEDKFYDLMTRGGGGYNQAATTDITTATGVGVWRHVVGVWKGAGTPQDTARIYINGKIATTTMFDDILNESDGRDMTTDVYIGVLWENGGLARPYHGRIDEVIASKVYRDSNWVKLSYASQGVFQTLTDIGVTEPDVPGAPTGVTATQSSTTTGALNVTWTAPEDNGGVAINGYTVTGSPDGDCVTTGATSCVISGLTPGEDYTFTVVATNSVGNSAASSASAPVEAPTAVLPGSFVIRMNGNPYSYRIPASAAASMKQVTMTISDMRGKRVWSRTINPFAGKSATLTWDGRNTSGMRVSAGMYIVRINATVNGENVKAIRKDVNLNP